MKSKKTKQIVGIACLSRRRRRVMCLHTVFVKALFRGKGIGEALVRRAVKEAKQEKCALSLGVNPLNYAAIKLYEKVGFKICTHQKLEMHI